MKQSELLKKIEELERRIRELEARPNQIMIPWPVYIPPMPQPNPWVSPYTPPTWCGTSSTETVTAGLVS
jgi:Zn-dependent protease with chaperone function